jgi:protein-disulfide isomerase
MHPVGSGRSGNTGLWVGLGVGFLLFTMAVAGAGVYAAMKSAKSRRATSTTTPTPVKGGAIGAENTIPAYSDSDSPVPVSSEDPMLGARDALVTIVVFSDLQCPFCKRLNETLNEVQNRYNKSDLRIIWKDNPLAFHAYARPAAIAGRNAFSIGGNESFWRFQESAFAKQTSFSSLNFNALAGESSNKSPSEFSQGIDDASAARKVDANMGLAKQLGLTGTPRAACH